MQTGASLARWRFFKPGILLVAIYLSAASGLAQGSTVSPAPMPYDATELMVLASRSNGILGEGALPWHLKVSYKELNEQGTVTGEGIIEQYWAGADKSRVSYKIRNYSHTTYWTEGGVFRVGDKSDPPYFLPAMLEQFVQPMPPSKFIEHYGFDLKEQKGGSTPLDCLSLKAEQAGMGFPGLVGRIYCLESGTPTLRISLLAQGGNQFLRNGIMTFQGRSVPTDLKVMFAGKPLFIANVDTLEVLKTVDEAEFSPPPGAVRIPRRITILGAVAQGFRLKSFPPEYPENAKASGIAGLVILRVVIDTNGRVVDAKPVSGPVELRKAASDSVLKWTYKPYLLNGEPVEVDTTVNVTFQLGR